MKKWILVAIVVLGFLLRVIGLSNHPAGFTPDEASFGYDAYSILKTGRDQWGHTLPLVFKSFGDDKLPVYTYLTVPSVAIFGLNEFAVRLPNVILGTLAIMVVYFLVRELRIGNWKLGILASFLLAISPWHTMLSRGAFEANLTSFFLPLGILFFLKSIKNQKFIFLSFFIFIINVFTYHTSRILTPLVFVSLIFIYKKELRNIKLSVIFFIGLLIISLLGYLSGGSRLVSSAITDINFSDDRYFAQVAGEPGIISKIFYNKPVYIGKQFLTNYFSYFSPQFLFTNGPGEGTYGMIPGVGVLYLAEIIIVIGGLLYVIRDGFKKKEIQLLFFWILISPIPAALTKGPGYAAGRASFMMPAIQILLAIGGIVILETIRSIKSKFLSKLILCSFVLLFSLNFIYVVEKYWVGQVVNESPSMIYGMSQVVNKVNNLQRKVVVAKSISEPQIYFAFYTKLNPVIYQNASKNWTLVNGWVDQQGSYDLEKYTFRNINYSVDSKLKNIILVGTPNNFPAEIKPNFIVNYPSLKPAYYIVINK